MEDSTIKKRKSEMEESSYKNVIIEPFYGGSHKQVKSLLVSNQFYS